MIVICEECGKKYRIDPLKIKRDSTRFKCTYCSHLISVRKPRTRGKESKRNDLSSHSTPSESKSEQTVKKKLEFVPKSIVKKRKKGFQITGGPNFQFGLTAKIFVVILVVSLVPFAIFVFFALNQAAAFSFADLFFVITISSVIILAWFSGKALSGPIIELNQTAHRISLGEMDTRISLQRKDEIGGLAEAISRMQDSLLLSLEKLRKRSEETSC
jgi:predicted Zn finger-like uncharacterized protein